jgi:glycerol kinase
MLFNINTIRWDRELLDVFNIPENILPKVQPSLGKAVFGYTRKNSVFGRKIPVCCVMGDQQASLFGHKCFNKGQVKCTFGTGSFLVSNTGTERFDSGSGLISTIFYQEEETKPYYALEGSIYNTGSTLKWLKDNMGLFKSYEDIDKMAEGIGYQSRLYLVPALTGLGAPYWDPDAGALLIGFEGSTSPGSIIRAAMESAAFRTRDIIQAMESDSGTSLKEIRIDGGVSRSRLFCQMLADITGKTIIRSMLEETTSLGVFLGACLAIGIWHGTKDIDVQDKSEAFIPKISRKARDNIYENWKRAVDRSRNWNRPQ